MWRALSKAGLTQTPPQSPLHVLGEHQREGDIRLQPAGPELPGVQVEHGRARVCVERKSSPGELLLAEKDPLQTHFCQELKAQVIKKK